MTLYNPEWFLDKKIKKWTLLNSQMIGLVFPQVTRDYKWQVYTLIGSQLVGEGVSPDRVYASAAVEKLMGFHFWIQPQYELVGDCRCGCCDQPTGKWRVWNREDTVDLVFDTEGEAIAWVVNKHAEDKE